MVLHFFSTDLKIIRFIGSEVSLVDPNFVAIITSQGVSVNYSTHKRVESGVETNLWLR